MSNGLVARVNLTEAQLHQAIKEFVERNGYANATTDRIIVTPGDRPGERETFTAEVAVTGRPVGAQAR